jgi:hypothetical protein
MKKHTGDFPCFRPLKHALALLLAIFPAIYSLAQNAPVSTAPVVTTLGNTVVAPITAINFSNIGSCNLKLTYNPAVATATMVTTGPLLGGNISTNLTIPGEISIGWYTFPANTLPNNSVIFNITFTRVASGVSPLAWFDDGYSCLWSDGNFNSLNDLPTSSYYLDGMVIFESNDAPSTRAATLNSCTGIVIDIPIVVSAFANIGKLALNLQYNSSVLTFQSWTNNSGFPGLSVNATVPGTITASGTVPLSSPPVTLVDGSVLFTLHCLFSSGTSNLNWFDNGSSCQYNGPPPSYVLKNDIPQSVFYYNGAITELPPPGPAGIISGPTGGLVCKGDTGISFSVAPIANAGLYHWALPPGAVITSGLNTNNITVAFGNNASAGDLLVYGVNNCGNGATSPPFPVTVNDPVVITGEPVSPPAIEEGNGIAFFKVDATGTDLTYQWEEYAGGWLVLSDGGVYEGTLTDSLTITNPPLSMNGYRYRCQVSGMCEPPSLTNGLAVLTVTPYVGIEDDPGKGNPALLDFRVAPNPANGEATVIVASRNSGILEIELFEPTGQKRTIHTGPVEQGLELRTSLTCQQLSPGLYLIRATFDPTGMSKSQTIRMLRIP